MEGGGPLGPTGWWPLTIKTHFPGSSCQAVASFVPEYMPFLCSSFQMARLTIIHSFSCSCPPPWLQCSGGQLSAPGGWAVQLSIPGSGHVYLPAAALPRYLLDPSSQPSPPSLRSCDQSFLPQLWLWGSGWGIFLEYHWTHWGLLPPSHP